ncbi:MAG: Type II/IV secretion system ATPase TadZ/CpaE, associated with Flp pilus assembly [Candidatus Jettenia ecosi]|uniref:Type II/IV secretion system ATPase TadZ/CpaE, associated with Flp pilus assembly n=1 Tax=Candidatus Jettenia ecosi TaxID=2494326 RepID=A0A533QAY8_9BACT|nr:MAG: Type II/IV secretion system ATPase TadZ/CpaE, associated with Flp pilus assembly [Candidatus Jettenia ecosi]
MVKNIISIRLEIQNQKIREELEEIISSLGGFQIHHTTSQVKNNGSYDLLIQELGDNPKKELQMVNNLQMSGTVRDIFLTSSITSPETLLEALKVGVRGFFPQPINKGEVRDALVKIKSFREQEKAAGTTGKRGKIIDIFGCKGGVGTTLIAANLATSIAELESTSSVALIDMNRFFGEISSMLNIESVFDWIKVAKNITRLDETYLMSIISRHTSGIYILPSPVELTEDYPVNPQDLEALLKLMQTMFDFIIIDSGKYLDDNAKAVMKMSDTVLLVCIQNLPCIINLKKLQDAFRKYGYPLQENTGIIVNRFVKNADISLDMLEKGIDKKVLCCIPNVYRTTMSAINQGKSLCTMAQGTEIHKKFKELASAFQEKGERKKGKGIFSLFSQ